MKALDISWLSNWFKMARHSDVDHVCSFGIGTVGTVPLQITFYRPQMGLKWT